VVDAVWQALRKRPPQCAQPGTPAEVRGTQLGGT